MELDDLYKNTESDGFDPNLDHQFAKVPKGLAGEGGIDFGFITEDIASGTGMKALPIRISHGEHRGATNGYGIRHILHGHGKELAEQNYFSVQDFVHENSEFEEIYTSDAKQDSWLLINRAKSNDGYHRILAVELHKSGKCYAVNSGYLREGWRRIKGVLVWRRRDVPH